MGKAVVVPGPSAKYVLVGHTDQVLACQFSPAARLVPILASAGDGTVRLWISGLEVRAIHAHVVAVRIRFSPDGQFLISSGPPMDSTVRVWEVASGVLRHTLDGHRGGVLACGFCPDGRLIVSAGHDGMVRVWDVPTGGLRHTLAGHSKAVEACSFSPDGELIVSAGREGTVRVWHTATGAPRHTLSGHRKAVKACSFSPDGRLIVSAGDDGTVRVWDAAGGQSRHVLEHAGPVYLCRFSPDGRLLASIGWSGAVRVWDVATGTQRYLLTGHTGPVYACAFSPDGRLLASAGADHTVRVWEVAETSTGPAAPDVQAGAGSKQEPKASAEEMTRVEHLLQQQPGVATLFRVRVGDSEATALAVREDWDHAGALPEGPYVETRSGLFLRKGVALIPLLVRVEGETYEAWINAHNPVCRGEISDLCDQQDFPIMVFVDSTQPVRVMGLPNPLRAAFKRYAEEVAKLDPWSMEAFDAEKAGICAEYPSVQALWEALGQPIDRST